MSEPTPAQCVESWLAASNLSHAIPNFRMAGLLSPRSFVEIELSYYEPLGIKRPEDRKRLFFLIQRVRDELEKSGADYGGENSGESGDKQEECGRYGVSPMNVSKREGRDNVRLAGSRSQPTAGGKNVEVGMSVDTSSSDSDPMSPVTLASPLADHDFPTTKPSAAAKRKETNQPPPRDRLEKELQMRRAMKNKESSIHKLENKFSSDSYTDDFDDEKSSIPSRRSRRSLLPRINRETTPKTISTVHSRPTIKKGNQSGLAGGAAARQKEGDEVSVGSETSDLSSSIQSFNSLGSSSFRKRGDENKRVDTKLPSRAGKRLSTIPSERMAPISPLAPLPGLDSNLNKSGDVKKPTRKSLGRPDTASSFSSTYTTSTNKSWTSVKTKTNLSSRPSSRSSIGSIGSRNLNTATTRPSSRSSIGSIGSRKVNTTTTLRKAPPKSPGRGLCAPPKSPTSSAKSPGRPTSSARTPALRERSVSPTPYSTRAMSPARNIKTAGSQSRGMSPARSIKTASTQGRVMSPARSIKTATSRDRSVTPARSIKTATPRSPVPAGRSRSPINGCKSPTNSGAVFVHGQMEDRSWSTQIAQLREGFQAEHEQVMSGQEAYQEDDEYEMRIRVIVRKRPMSKREAELGDTDVIHPLDYADHGRILVYQPKTKLDLAKEVETTSFAFDNVFNEESNNLEIYWRAVRNLIPGVFRGKWASVFAYGQTGSGKTFTMMGSNMTGIKAGNQHENLGEENLGLYFLAARDVFRIAEEHEYQNISINVSLFEIYGGKLIDLLNKRNQVRCLEDSKGKVCFPGLSEYPVYDADELMEIIEKGSLNRSTGTTSANADSSRSHAVLQLSLRKDVGRVKGKEHSRLSFIDLAGSERGADTNQASKTTRMEGAEINTSLLALKEVIRALATGSSMKRIPFRGSKLTQVLKDSFVGKNTRTVMVSCVAPNMKNCDHTLNTLRYADRVKERDPQSGQLSAAVAAHSLIKRDQNDLVKVKLPQRPLTAPAASFRVELVEESSDEDEIPPPPLHSDRLFPDENDSVFQDDEEDNIVDKSGYSDVFDDYKTVESEEEDSLDVALRSPVPAQRTSNDIPSLTAQRTNEDSAEAARSLIATHKSIMVTMLSMVKHEMTLVNDTDVVDGNFNEYLAQIGTLTDNHLSLLSTLRESLQNYNASKVSTVDTEPNNIFPSLSNDSYEDEYFDLRD